MSAGSDLDKLIREAKRTNRLTEVLDIAFDTLSFEDQVRLEQDLSSRIDRRKLLWVTTSGEQYRLYELSDEYVLNAERVLRRRIFEADSLIIRWVVQLNALRYEMKCRRLSPKPDETFNKS